jgi:hypothetical protein
MASPSVAKSAKRRGNASPVGVATGDAATVSSIFVVILVQLEGAVSHKRTAQADRHSGNRLRGTVGFKIAG